MLRVFVHWVQCGCFGRYSQDRPRRRNILALPRPDPLDPNYGVDGLRIAGKTMSPEESKRWAERVSGERKSRQIYNRDGITRIQAHGITHMVMGVMIVSLAGNASTIVYFVSVAFAIAMCAIGAIEIQQE